MADTDALWGGYVTDLRIDMTAREAVATVEVTSEGQQRTYGLTLTGVRSLRVERSDGEWKRTELTEVHTATAGGLTTVELIFRTEPNGLVATCESLRVESD